MEMSLSSPAHQPNRVLLYNQATMAYEPEVYICVDIESAGPVPGDYSLLSIGACTIFEPQQSFYIELKPINHKLTEEASAIHQLSLERLKKEGASPRKAFTRFEEWLKGQAGASQQPIFVAFNAPFDWMFINYYFLHYLGHNPFGHAAIDIKAFYMGLAGVPWSETSWRYISPKYVTAEHLTHHALQDALDQADIFKKMLEESRRLNLPIGANLT
jgi:DNA polymerase III epsilon subunit-like protein